MAPGAILPLLSFAKNRGMGPNQDVRPLGENAIKGGGDRRCSV